MKKRKSISLEEKDRNILDKLLKFIDKGGFLDFQGKLICEVGKFFLRAPYRVCTLEGKGPETTVINLREFDCFTFVENVVALSQYIKSKRRSFESFKKILKRIRYRRGVLKGYTSRLHYYSDWIYDNQRKGILRDITKEIGGRPFKKVVDFMTVNEELYPSLKIPKNFRRMRDIERMITKRGLFFIPKKMIKYLEDKFLDGDLIGVTTERKGLDVQHAGIAIRIGGKIHLLHASRREGKVAISKKPLNQYILTNKNYSGIMVARVKE